MDEKRERGKENFLPCQLSGPGLPDYPEGRWSRDWTNAAASTGLVPARWGWLRQGGLGKEVNEQTEKKSEKN